MRLDGHLDVFGGNVQAIFEDAVKKKALAVMLRLSALEINQYWVDSVNLLIRLRLDVADGCDEHEQFWAVICDFRK